MLGSTCVPIVPRTLHWRYYMLIQPLSTPSRHSWRWELVTRRTRTRRTRWVAAPCAWSTSRCTRRRMAKSASWPSISSVKIPFDTTMKCPSRKGFSRTCTFSWRTRPLLMISLTGLMWVFRYALLNRRGQIDNNLMCFTVFIYVRKNAKLFHPIEIWRFIKIDFNIYILFYLHKCVYIYTTFYDWLH